MEFKVITVNDYLGCYVLLTTTEDPYYLYNDLYECLSSNMGRSFSIIIDLFLRNGFTFNRFIELEFIDGKAKTRIINPREVAEEIKESTREYLKKNTNLLYDSALSQSTINFVLA